MANCKVVGEILQLLHSLRDEMSQPIDYGLDAALYHSEVDFLHSIHADPAMNASGIARELNLTKGAVTQISQKLCRKGLIEVRQRADNKKEKYFLLTEEGEAARLRHEQYHGKANQSLCAYLSSLSKGQAETIFAFLEKLEECSPFSEFSCQESPECAFTEK